MFRFPRVDDIDERSDDFIDRLADDQLNTQQIEEFYNELNSAFDP